MLLDLSTSQFGDMFALFSTFALSSPPPICMRAARAFYTDNVAPVSSIFSASSVACDQRSAILRVGAAHAAAGVALEQFLQFVAGGLVLHAALVDAAVALCVAGIMVGE
jgi:hypothetical protein